MKNLLKYNEYFTLAIALLLFFYSPTLLRMVDPTAAAFDAGVLQMPILSIVYFCIFQAFVWAVMGIVWPHIRKYYENEINDHFNKLEPWQKVKFALSLYLSLFLFLVLLSKI